jgi:hypothetical protein
MGYYVFNRGGCLLGLIAFIVAAILVKTKIVGDVPAMLIIAGVLFSDLAIRARAHFRRHPATREPHWWFLPSAGAHFNYVPIWIYGLFACLIPLGLSLVHAFYAREYAAPQTPIVQNPPPGPRDVPPPEIPVVRPPRQPRPPQQPTSEGAKFEYEVRKSQPQDENPTYEIFVTSRHDKPLKILVIGYTLIAEQPGKNIDQTVTERNVAPGQRLTAILKPDKTGRMILINGSGREEDGTRVSFSCRWPL